LTETKYTDIIFVCMEYTIHTMTKIKERKMLNNKIAQSRQINITYVLFFCLIFAFVACEGNSPSDPTLSGIDADDFGAYSSITKTFVVTNKIQWENAINSINSGGNSQNYVIAVNGNLTGTEAVNGILVIDPVDITVSLRRGGTIGLGTNGSILSFKESQTFILRDIHLIGKNGNTSPVVDCNKGILIMHNPATIRDNEGTGGCGVFIYKGIFTMYGGSIRDNTETTYDGAGVNLADSKFTIYDGIISGNISNGCGGGVMCHGTVIFTMHGGVINGNTSALGGGVEIGDGSFTMLGGEISGNTSSSFGGGVHSYETNITKTGGTIYGNTGDSNIANIARGNTGSPVPTWGHAICYREYDGSTVQVYYRDTTLGTNDNISTAILPANSGDSLGNWTKE
jgi:hypothetical protein